MASEVCLVLHRKSANEPAVKEAVRHVRDAGYDLRVRIPWNKKDKPRVVREALAGGATRIIAGGGDGTINAVVNALVRKKEKRVKPVLGILPLGTANDFAHGLGLPVKDLGQCLEIACSAAPRFIDVGKANSRYFINVTSGGFGAEITATTPVGMKKALSGVAYTIMGLIKAFDLKPYRGRLLVPGEEPVEGGIGNFAAAVNLENSEISCNDINLNGEHLGGAFSYDDRGGNLCGCAELSVCKVLTSNLDPPSTLDN